MSHPQVGDGFKRMTNEEQRRVLENGSLLGRPDIEDELYKKYTRTLMKRRSWKEVPNKPDRHTKTASSDDNGLFISNHVVRETHFSRGQTSHKPSPIHTPGEQPVQTWPFTKYGDLAPYW